MSDFISINPATGERVKRFPTASDADVERAVGESYDAYLRWRHTDAQERARVLQNAADLHRDRIEMLARVLTEEVGKTITQAKGEVELVASIYEYYAQQGPSFLADEPLRSASGGEAVVRTEPIGPLFGVMPWNFPYYQVARFAAPNIMLGNTILLKHAPNCPRSAVAIEELLLESGLPDGVYINLFADHAQAASIIANPRVQGVSLTGSDRAGSQIGEIAGRHMKKYVLELGGSDPFIVLDEANLRDTVDVAVNNRMRNAGQTCIASKRFIVLEAVYDDFLDLFVTTMREWKPGDPGEPDTRFGPLSSKAAVADLAEQVQDAVAKGATLLTGGRTLDDPGAFYEATVLTDVTPDMRAYSEELFGPAAVIHKVGSDEEAIELANRSPYGLGAVIFGSDPLRVREIAERLEVGMVWINGMSRSAPDLPFGGTKRSGVGRELGKFGMNEFVNKKLIHTS